MQSRAFEMFSRLQTEVLRENMSVLLSIRSDHGSSIRGVDYQQLQDLLEELNALTKNKDALTSKPY